MLQGCSVRELRATAAESDGFSLSPQPQSYTGGELCPLSCAFLLTQRPRHSLPPPFITCHLVVTGLILLGPELTTLTSMMGISIRICCDAVNLV